jgi:hypothetical protein
MNSRMVLSGLETLPPQSVCRVQECVFSYCKNKTLLYRDESILIAFPITCPIPDGHLLVSFPFLKSMQSIDGESE